jgi:hypothetical protein
MDRALIIDEPWISKILSGKKRFEMRSRHTNIRGRIGLIKKGSGLIVGEAYLENSVKLKQPFMYKEAHRIDYDKNPELYKYNIAWLLHDVKKYAKPIPYDHPQGAVIWVKINLP